ncbi:MAG TPA: hypothetical protein PLR78_07340 [Polaromonas sp.]|nr:hypothetical protein [Polaromonas sp.]HQS90093.1 hypothetical protein [Polaromonas sp.]
MRQALVLEQQAMMRALKHLATSINHIKSVVAIQQSSEAQAA